MIYAQIHVAGLLCSSADSMLAPRSARQHPQSEKAISRRQLPGSCVFSVDWAGDLGLGRFAGGAPPLPSLFPSLNCEVAAPPRRRTSSNLAI